MPNSDNYDALSGPVTTRRNVLLTLSAAAGGSLVGGRVAGGSTGGVTAGPDVRKLTLNHERTTVTHSAGLDDPVVVATPLSYNGGHEASTRIDRVGPDGFDAAVEEWTYLDGNHVEESVGSLAVGAGAVRFDDGPLIVAGTVEAGTESVRAEFDEPFPKRPVVLTGTQTRNVSRPVVTRNERVSTDGVSVRLQGEEGTPFEGRETVGFVAVERGTGTLGGKGYEAGVVTGVEHEWYTIEFDGKYENPTFLADMQTTNGPDTATLRYRNLRKKAVEVFVEEERSKDDEIRHAEEDVGYLVVEGGTGADSPTPDAPDAEGFGGDGFGGGSYGV